MSGLLLCYYYVYYAGCGTSFETLFFLFWQILLSRTIHFLSNILAHQANVFFVSLRTHEEHWGVTFTKCFNKCFGIFRLWMAYFWPSLASCSSRCYYSCLTASGAVAQRDLITRDAIIHRGWCQYYDNFTFHSPPRWSPDWLKVSDITRAVEANATVGVVQFLLLCSQQTSNYIEQTGRDAYHLTRRGTSVWTHRSGTAGAPLESLWGHDNNLGASLESGARKKEKGCCSNTLS